MFLFKFYSYFLFCLYFEVLFLIVYIIVCLFVISASWPIDMFKIRGISSLRLYGYDTWGSQGFALIATTKFPIKNIIINVQY